MLWPSTLNRAWNLETAALCDPALPVAVKAVLTAGLALGLAPALLNDIQQAPRKRGARPVVRNAAL